MISKPFNHCTGIRHWFILSFIFIHSLYVFVFDNYHSHNPPFEVNIILTIFIFFYHITVNGIDSNRHIDLLSHNRWYTLAHTLQSIPYTILCIKPYMIFNRATFYHTYITGARLNIFIVKKLYYVECDDCIGGYARLQHSVFIVNINTIC